MVRKICVLAAACAVPSMVGAANAAALYSQDFDAVGQAALVSPGAGTAPGTASLSVSGWVAVVSNNVNTASMLGVGQATTGGYANGGYLASGDGTDFGLYLYDGSNGKPDYIQFSYQAPTKTENISGQFDFEAAWSRYDSSTLREGGFLNGLKYQINGSAWVSLIAGGQLHASNSAVPAAVTWLTDAQMDAAGMAHRNLSFSLPGVSLNAGDVLNLRWDQSVYAGSTYKNVATGIDNFSLSGTPVPVPAAVWGGITLLSGLGCFGGLKRLRRKPA